MKQTRTPKSTMNSRQVRIILPVLLTLFLIPLVVRGVTVNTYLENYEWYSKATKTVDVFLYSKAIVFIILSSIMLGILSQSIWKQRKSNQKFKIKTLILEEKCFIPLIIYLLLTILSTIFSNYTSFAIHGMVGQYETLWVLFGYIIVAYYTYRFVCNTEQIQLIIIVFMISITLVITIGVGQYFKHDFFRTSLGSSLISKNELSFRFAPRHIYSTLYNPNYVGLFIALIVPLVVVLMIYSKSIAKKILYGIIFTGTLICVYGSQSSSGILGSAIALLVLCILILIGKYRRWQLNDPNSKSKEKKIILSGLILIIVCFVVNYVIGNPIGSRLTQVNNQYNNNSMQQHSKLSSINSGDDKVTLVYNSKELNIQFINDNGRYNFNFFDENNNVLEHSIDETGAYVSLLDTVFSGIKISLVNFDDTLAFQVQIDDKPWYFTNQTDGTYYLINTFGKTLKVNQQEKFKSYWTFGSGRGYIWEKTIPIIKKHPLLGTGPDTFALYFPNTEYLNLYHAGFNDEIVTKPHSLYLQIAAQTGIPSLISILIFFIMYLVSSVCTFYNYSIDSYEAKIGIGILAGSCGYMFSSLTNDSTITVAPVFWTLIGLGLAINRLIKKTAQNDI